VLFPLSGGASGKPWARGGPGMWWSRKTAVDVLGVLIDRKREVLSHLIPTTLINHPESCDSDVRETQPRRTPSYHPKVPSSHQLEHHARNLTQENDIILLSSTRKKPKKSLHARNGTPEQSAQKTPHPRGNHFPEPTATTTKKSQNQAPTQ
jgi:hypothetical protein